MVSLPPLGSMTYIQAISGEVVAAAYSYTECEIVITAVCTQPSKCGGVRTVMGCHGHPANCFVRTLREEICGWHCPDNSPRPDTPALTLCTGRDRPH